MSSFVLSQVLVGFAALFIVSSFQFTDQRLVRLCLALGGATIAWHFWLLEVHTAALMSAIACLRFLTAIFWRNKGLFYLFMALVLANTIFSYAGYLTILAALATSFATWGAFRNSDRELRVCMMAAAGTMLVHNLFALTPAGVLLEAFFLGSNCLAYYRMYIRKVA